MRSTEHNRPAEALRASLRAGEPTIWSKGEPPLPRSSPSLALTRLADARARFDRFAPALGRLFGEGSWDGRIRSPLRAYPIGADDRTGLWVKCDHELPLTGTIKARGGVHEVLQFVEETALRLGLVTLGEDYACLADARARTALAERRVGVGSTGNLGLSVGMAARAFGLQAEVHMSADAKAWKKVRLRALGVEVVEHEGDYADAVAAARARFQALGDHAHFVDDEHSEALFVGYAVAAYELAEQLEAAGIGIDDEHPLFVYLPCGVGGAPGGISYGLKAIYGDDVRCVFAEPVASASMLAALAFPGPQPTSVYALGLTNRTLADGLATPAASQLVLDLVGDEIDAVVALPDDRFLHWVGEAWAAARVRVEPSAAAGFAAWDHLAHVSRGADRPAYLYRGWARATHIVWTTGGAMLPDAEFRALLPSV
nr:D-serine ammonia-lyase [Sphingomonas sp. Y57]